MKARRWRTVPRHYTQSWNAGDHRNVTDRVDSASDATALRDRVRSAVVWRSGSQIVAQIVMWGVTILVVRLLDPHDYGLFAMTQVVLVLFNFLNGYSFASSLVQAESVTRDRIAQVFGLLIVLNAGLAIIQVAAAPLAASYFHQPLVGTMLRVQALLYLPTPFIALPSALLARGLDFRKQAMANFASAIAGAATALGCALGGLGVWTLVAAPIVMFTVRAIGLTIAARVSAMSSGSAAHCFSPSFSGSSRVSPTFSSVDETSLPMIWAFMPKRSF